MVVLVVGTDGGHVAVGLVAQLLEAFAKHEEFEFGGDCRCQPHLLQAIDLMFQYRTR